MPHRQRRQRPHIGNQGVSAQRSRYDQIPKLGIRIGGTGVAAQRVARPELLTWFAALQDRLHGVIVLNRDWTSALTPTVLMQTATSDEASGWCAA